MNFFLPLFSAALLVLVSQPAAAFTVNSTGNTSDSSVGNGECWTGAMIAAGKECTLFAAIQEVNAAPGGGSIGFSGVTSITVSGIPGITKPVVINGGLPGNGRVELKGASGADNHFTLVVKGGSSTLTALSFPGGVKLETGGQNVVSDCFFGTDVTGTIARGGNGLLIQDSADNMILDNVLSGINTFQTGGALAINGPSSTGNLVKGNFIGTDPTGTTLLSNGINSAGVMIRDASDNVIGGAADGEANVIAGGTCIAINGLTARENVIIGNLLGTDVTGTKSLEHFGGYGVFILNAPANRIGGTGGGEGNVISGNNNGGIHIEGTDSSLNKILGNLIGTDPSGERDVPTGPEEDDRQNVGVRIMNAPANVVGGTADGAGNTISGNLFGVALEGAGSVGNRVEGNNIGPRYDGEPLGNVVQGVYVTGSNNTIGGTEPDAGNVIAFNGFNGVWVANGGGNAVVGNWIFGNDLLGIDLGLRGVTENDDVDDADSGANELQNFPEFAADGQGVLQGVLDSVPNTSFLIEFFSIENCDPSGNGEGENRLGTTTVTTDGNGVAAFTPPQPARGFFLTATATRLDPTPRSTSEFSPCAASQAPQASNVLTVDSTGDAPDASPGDGSCRTAGNVCTLRAAIQEANVLAKTQTIAFKLPTPPFTIRPGSPLPEIDRALFIDGFTQPGTGEKPTVEIDGSNAGAGTHGLVVSAGKSLVRGLVINRFKGNGIILTTKGKNRVEGNFIGTDVTGEEARPNEGSGIFVTLSAKHLIGPLPNLISGNGLHGIHVSFEAKGVLIQGNTIGTSFDRTVAVPNGLDGVHINGDKTTKVAVGGLTLGSGNLISGNDRAGVFVEGDGGNLVLGNTIGLDGTGSAALDNGTGVVLRSGGNVVGHPDAPNVISGNLEAGIEVFASFGNQISGNLIGTDRAGTAAVGNATGIALVGAQKTKVGGKKDALANVVSGNDVGIAIDGSDAFGNVIQKNVIGTDRAQTAQNLGNRAAGVLVRNEASRNKITSNAIVRNGTLPGVVGGVIVLSGVGNALSGNVVADNGGQGIDLGGDGRSPIDPGDADAGGNNLQNAPVLTAATLTAGKLLVEGTISSTPATGFTLELFAAASCNPTAPNANRFVKKLGIKTTDAGTGTFAFTAKSTLPVAFVTATVTAKGGHTSELAECIPVSGGP